MKKFLIVLFLFMAQNLTAQDGLVGHWTFDDPNNLTQAEVGNNLILLGSQTAVAGPDSTNGAVNIGVGSYYIAAHGIQPNGGGSRVNEFTIVMDIKIPILGRWYCFYQTDATNTDDGDWFINPSGAMGVGATGYTDAIFQADEWYRIAITVKNGSRYDYYVDGETALIGSAGGIDGRFSMGVTTLLFADQNGEDNALDVADVKIFSRALSNSEIEALGGYGHNSVFVPTISYKTYLQTPTPTSIYVCWHGQAGDSETVEYGTSESLGNSTPSESIVLSSQYIWRTAKLTGLQPETVYYYRVTADTLSTEIKRFKTPPVNGKKTGHVRFAVYGDNRTDIRMHEQVIAAMKNKMKELYGENLEENINCVLDVGDIVTRGSSLMQYKAEYFDPITPISGNVPFMVSIGNHEGEADYYYQYMKYEDFGGAEGEKYYSFRIGRVLFIGLNSNWQLRNDTQITWLDNLLSVAQNDTSIDWIFAYNHHPGHSEIWPDGNTDYVQDRTIPTLKKYSKVDMLMYGHSHNYERGAVRDGNLRLMLSGGAGSALDRWGMYSNQTDYPEIQKAFDHYCYAIFDIDIVHKKYVATTYSLGNPPTSSFGGKWRDNEIIDHFFRDKAHEEGPDKPVPVSPVADAEVGSSIELQASPYSGSDEMMSSRFQVTTSQGNYDSPIVDVIRDFEDLYWDTGAPDYLPVNLNAGIDLTKFTAKSGYLEEGKKYWWRVQYRDKNLQWSAWSDEGSFEVKIQSAVSDKPVAMVKKYRLYTNYPNPFNPATTFRFDLQKQGDVLFRIYSADGALVKTLMDQNLAAGEHVLIWDGTDKTGIHLPTGVYFYKIQANNFRDMGKAVLLK